MTVFTHGFRATRFAVTRAPARNFGAHAPRGNVARFSQGRFSTFNATTPSPQGNISGALQGRFSLFNSSFNSSPLVRNALLQTRTFTSEGNFSTFTPRLSSSHLRPPTTQATDLEATAEDEETLEETTLEDTLNQSETEEPKQPEVVALTLPEEATHKVEIPNIIQAHKATSSDIQAKGPIGSIELMTVRVQLPKKKTPTQKVISAIGYLLLAPLLAIKFIVQKVAYAAYNLFRPASSENAPFSVKDFYMTDAEKEQYSNENHNQVLFASTK